MSSGAVPSDQLLWETIFQLESYYRRFPWESEVWRQFGHRRSPYRALVLFGLSPRTKDRLLVEMCRWFFESFPNVGSFLQGWDTLAQAHGNPVRQGQKPFLDSAWRVLADAAGTVPQKPEEISGIWGVGDKISECVLAYGWGLEALPLDGNGCRVVYRLQGLAISGDSRSTRDLRNRLKGLFHRRLSCFRSRNIAMVDIHEILRLHGQVICTRAPRCSMCPVIGCKSRKYEYAGQMSPRVSSDYWQEWRELLLDPVMAAAGGQAPTAGQMANQGVGDEYSGV